MIRKTVAGFALILATRSLTLAGVNLDAVIPYFSKDNQPIDVVLQDLGRQYQVSIVADPDVKGSVNTELYNTTLRDALDAILEPEGYFWEVKGSNVKIHRFRTVDLFIEYPQMERSGSSQSAINLGSNSYSGVGGTGLSGYNSTSSSTMTTSQTGSGGSQQQDQGNLKIETENKGEFWGHIADEFRSYLRDGEKIRLNRTAGILSVTGTGRTIAEIRDHLNNLNARLGEQVEITGEVVEVTLNNQDNLGVDWNVAAFRIGEAIRVGKTVTSPTTNVQVSGIKSPTAVMSAPGGFTFDPSSLTGTIGIGKVDVVVSALQEQGKVNSLIRPRLVTGNNQTAYIKVAEDRPFFRLLASTQITTGSTGVAQPILQNQYTVIPVSIGNIFGVTPQVAKDGTITMDVTPTFTRLKDIVTSPDGTQTAPALSVNQTATFVRMKEGETAIIGGLLLESSLEQQRKVPLLGDIPGIGRVFQSKGTMKTKSEIVILLTARRRVPGESLEKSKIAEHNAAAVQAAATEPNVGEAKPVVENVNLLR